MEYGIYIIIGIGMGLSMTNIMTSKNTKVQNAKDNLEAKKEWLRMLSSQNKSRR
jgi:hypothetical protein